MAACLAAVEAFQHLLRNFESCGVEACQCTTAFADEVDRDFFFAAHAHHVILCDRKSDIIKREAVSLRISKRICFCQPGPGISEHTTLKAEIGRRDYVFRGSTVFRARERHRDPKPVGSVGKGRRSFPQARLWQSSSFLACHLWRVRYLRLYQPPQLVCANALALYSLHRQSGDFPCRENRRVPGSHRQSRPFRSS